MKIQVWAFLLVLLSSIIGAFGPIFFKKASKSFSLNIIKIVQDKNLIIGAACYGLATIIFIPALKGGDLSVIYPLVSMVYIFVSLYSIKFLKEKMNYFKWLGVAFIILGVTFIGIGA